jgi:hypothetical protein
VEFSSLRRKLKLAFSLRSGFSLVFFHDSTGAALLSCARLDLRGAFTRYPESDDRVITRADGQKIAFPGSANDSLTAW